MLHTGSGSGPNRPNPVDDVGWDAARTGLHLVGLLVLLVLGAWIRQLVKRQRGTHAELRRLRRRQDRSREEQQQILASLGYAHGSLEVLQKMVRESRSSPPDDTEIGPVDWRDEERR